MSKYVESHCLVCGHVRVFDPPLTEADLNHPEHNNACLKCGADKLGDVLPPTENQDE